MFKYKKTGKGRAAKNTAWKNFSDYIRLRDCLKTTGSAEYCKCITCGEVVPYEQIQAGHAIPSRKNGILYDEEIVYGQCVKCNEGGCGEEQIYKKILVELHGEEWYEEKKRNKKQPLPMNDAQYRIISKYFLKKRKELQEKT